MSGGLGSLRSLHRLAIFAAAWNCGTAGIVNAQRADALNGFYVVSTEYFDAQPFRMDHILEVRADGADSVVRYSRIAPMDAMCLEAMTVKTATVRLPGVSPSQLVAKDNLCTIDAAALNRELRKRTRPVAALGFKVFGIVATCGTRTVVVHLPDSKAVNLKNLEKTKPQLARWWQLPASVRERAFGPNYAFDRPSPSQNEEFQREGLTTVRQILAGRFDAGLDSACVSAEPCAPASLRALLTGYAGPVVGPAHIPRLLSEDQYRFSKYVPPSYPPLAVQARITGAVRVELEVDPQTGDVRDAKAASGHPLLSAPVVAAARQWKFVPEALTGVSLPTSVEFAFERACPAPVSK